MVHADSSTILQAEGILLYLYWPLIVTLLRVLELFDLQFPSSKYRIRFIGRDTCSIVMYSMYRVKSASIAGNLGNGNTIQRHLQLIHTIHAIQLLSKCPGVYNEFSRGQYNWSLLVQSPPGPLLEL